jgi:hypothetical protein
MTGLGKYLAKSIATFLRILGNFATCRKTIQFCGPKPRTVGLFLIQVELKISSGFENGLYSGSLRNTASLARGN